MKKRLAIIPILLTSFVPFISAETNVEEGSSKRNKENVSVTARLLKSGEGTFGNLDPYDNNYLIYTYTSRLNRDALQSYSWAEGVRKDEAKFQLSFAFPIIKEPFGERTVLAASYTQESWWQAFNPKHSSPFRETNYQPQIFVGYQPDISYGNWSFDDFEFGFNHQSNGRGKPTSRSWNRIYMRGTMTYDDFFASLKVWYRLPERESKDDNPDITKYLGYYALTLGYKYEKSTFTAKGHYNWNTGYGNIELGWSYPLNDYILFYSQLFTGYGESMIDYNFNQTRVGVGISINDIF